MSQPIDAVADLVRRRLAVDGGLPLVAEPGFLAGRYGPPATLFTATGADGALTAAAGVRARDAAAVVAFVADPGPDAGPVLDAALAHARALAAPVEVESEFVTGWAQTLFAERGLRPVFAEDVLRYDLAAPLPPVPLPDGVTILPWADDLAPRFFAVYAAAFAERPGFPGWTADQWTGWTVDDEFRPAASLLATDTSGTDIGFVTSANGWIVQVGVVPEARGGGLGAALLVEALRRHRDAGSAEVLLDVSVDNPAGRLYRRMGFTAVGRRGRFRAPEDGTAEAPLG